MSEYFRPVKVLTGQCFPEFYDHLRDNNYIKIQGKVFDSYVPEDHTPSLDYVLFHETDNKPLPESLKNGTDLVIDVWAIVAPGPAYKP